MKLKWTVAFGGNEDADFEKASSDFSHYLAWFLISRQHTKRAQGKEEKKCYQWRKHRRCQYT